MILPYRIETPSRRWPIVNYLIVALTIVVSTLAILQPHPRSFGAYDPLVLDGWALPKLFGFALLHANFAHLLVNVIFLWLFGNAICAKIGNGRYLLLYITLVGATAAAHNLFRGEPGVGATGAINALAGMSLIWYAGNEVRGVWWLGTRGRGTFAFDCWALAAIWLMFGFIGAMFGVTMNAMTTSYLAHLLAFAAGAALAAGLIWRGRITIVDGEVTLFDLIRELQAEPEEKGPDRRTIQQRAAVFGSAAVLPTPPARSKREEDAIELADEPADESSTQPSDEATDAANFSSPACPHCGRPLAIDATRSSDSRCPHCLQPLPSDPPG